MTFAEILAEKGAEAGLSFTPLQLEQFSRYYELLVETNKVMNLTAITEPEEVAVKHMVDSLLPTRRRWPVKPWQTWARAPAFPVCR